MKKIVLVECVHIEMGLIDQKAFSTWAKANKWLDKFLKRRFGDVEIIQDTTHAKDKKCRCREVFIRHEFLFRPIISRYRVTEYQIDNLELAF